MCYVTFVKSLVGNAALGKHTTYEFQTHFELDAPSVMCSYYKRGDAFIVQSFSRPTQWPDVPVMNDDLLATHLGG